MTYGPVDGEMTNLEYDCRNRLVKAGKVSYTYDCENTRTAATEDGITTEYVTDTGGSLSRILIAYENIGTANTSETYYYYGPEGLAAQNNDTTGQYFAYHYDNIGSTTLVTDKTGRKVEEFAYGTYGELLTEPKNNIRFLYNGSYGVVTDSNGLYYMRARYYNPDIKRFINQDMKVGDISNGQGLNRYAYCEGNPVSMVDPFGLCGENANDQGKVSKYEKWHSILGTAGMFWDGFDFINGILYFAEKDPVNGFISIACGLPAVGNLIACGAKTAKAISRAETILNICKTVGKAGNTAAAAKAMYDTYQVADKNCKTTGGKIAYMAGTLAAGYVMGKAAQWGAGKLKNLAVRAIPKLKTAVQEGAEKFVSKIASGSSNNSGVIKTNRGYIYWPFGASGKKINIDLYAFGNTNNPRGARPKDFNVQSMDDIVGPEKGPLPLGASNASDVEKAPLTGAYHKLPAGTVLPEGLDYIADGKDVLPNSEHYEGHYTIFPTRKMTINEFNELFQSLPWEYKGKKKK